MKYFTMLRYIASTVIEVDLDSGIYHLVYQQNEDFQDLRAGITFEESLRVFVQTSVYPEDRTAVTGILNRYMEDFFNRGLMKYTQNCRVLHRETGEYIWYACTALRVDLDNPKRHKALIVWKQQEQASAKPAPVPEEPQCTPIMQNLSVGIQRCLNDEFFSILYVNEGFITLFAYSREEIAEKFHNHFLEMIHPDDRMAVRRQFVEQIAAGALQELEYRVFTKSGKTIWILDRCKLVAEADGLEYLDCTLTDITQIKRAQEELRLTMESYEIIQNQTNDIIFRADLQTGEVFYSPNWVEKFGYQPLTQHIFSQINTASHIFPEDIPALMKLISDICAGVPYGETELRIANADGKYLWCRIRATTQFNDLSQPVRVVGVISDIDADKRRTQELLDKAQQDALTGLYNKSTALEKIKRKLEKREASQHFAMMIIDLDNFKQINDSHGHMFGDAVLAEAASRLKLLCDMREITARFGGDEFLIFLEFDGVNDAVLQKKALKIIETFQFIQSEELQGFQLTCSIGISRCPEDGLDFQNLFQRCDRALYQAKMGGKNQFAVYEHKTMSKTFGFNMENAFTAGTRIESDEAADYNIDSIVPQVFQKLYESGDVETAVNAILETVGRRYNVSRVYIFEESEDGAWCKNTFEWCNEGVLPEIGNLQHVSYEDLGGNYQGHFDENGIFYCQDISTLRKGEYELLARQGIRSLLQCAVRDSGKFAGFVGFDDCTILRMWTQSQIDALRFIAELLSTFLLKKRAQDRALTAAEDLRTILDNQNSWIYVIDPDRYTLLYINAKTQHTVPEVQLGMRCYEAFFHRDSPCERCPARGIRQARNQTLEVYNPLLQVWSLADASLIGWGDRDACLLSCHDITPYMADEKRKEPERS